MKRPPFCPHLTCKLHNKANHGNFWYTKQGYYGTKAFGKVQRYRCRNCGGYFSSQSFSIDYYAKKVISYCELLKKLVSTSSIRDMARDFRVSTDTVMNRLLRCSRQAISFHEELKNDIAHVKELVADGFESFCVSQYFPNNIHLLALKDSQFIYFMNYVTIRRKGRMTETQKSKRKTLETRYTPPYKGIHLSFSELLDEVVQINSYQSHTDVLTLFTDEKPEYVEAQRKHKGAAILIKENKLSHKRINSKKIRNNKNPLFSVNYLDREIRKDLANHVRETVCFSRNVNNCMERLMIYNMYHNYMKVFREKQRKKDKRTHAEIAGIPRQKIAQKLKTIFTQRRFLSLENIKGFNLRLWLRQLFTPLRIKVEYIPKFLLA